MTALTGVTRRRGATAGQGKPGQEERERTRGRVGVVSNTTLSYHCCMCWDIDQEASHCAREDAPPLRSSQPPHVFFPFFIYIPVLRSYKLSRSFIHYVCFYFLFFIFILPNEHMIMSGGIFEETTRDRKRAGGEGVGGRQHRPGAETCGTATPASDTCRCSGTKRQARRLETGRQTA